MSAVKFYSLSEKRFRKRSDKWLSISDKERASTRFDALRMDPETTVATDRLSSFFGWALFLSGTSSLVYQVLWVRQLSLVVGMDVYSITIAVSAFFAGLAVGSALFGRVVDRSANPIRLYALLEVLIAVCAVLTTLLLAHSPALFIWLQSHVGLLAWMLPYVLVGAPAILMGGTIPVAVGALSANSWQAGSEPQVARTGGILYAANAAGGIAGALLSSFAFLPWFGVRGTALAAACINLVAAAIALSMRKIAELVGNRKGPVVSAAVVSSTALVLYSVAGGIALGYEVVWSQAIAQFVSTRSFAFSIVLAVYLTGLAVGSWIGARLAGRVRDRWGWFGLLIGAAGLVAMLEFAVLGPWAVKAQVAVGNSVLVATGSYAMRMYASFAVAGLSMVFVPSVLLGAAFPMALGLIVGARQVGRNVGSIVAANTAGGIAGTLLTGFVLIPALGLVLTLGTLAISAAVVGTVAAFLSPKTSPMKWVVAASGMTVILVSVLTPSNQLAKLLLTTRGGGMLVFYEEGRAATVAIAQQRSKDNVFRRLYIQGVSNSGDAMPSMRYMRLQAMLPLLIHTGEPKSAMIVGFGTGITAGETLRYPGLEKRVCAELLPAVVRSGEMFPENYKAWSDPRLEIRIRDGRQELMRSKERYDVITMEPPPPSAQGVANLYSTEFYELAKSKLESNGLFAQWLPIGTQTEDDTRSLVRSFLDAFPYATLWSSELHEMLLVGSMSPIRLNSQNIAERFSAQTVAASLSAVGVDSPAALLATWVTDREGLERFAGRAKPVTDDRPRIEYGSWVQPDEIGRVLPRMLAMKTEVPVIGASADLRSEVQRKQAGLMDFYMAGIAAYRGDERGWREAIARLHAEDTENAYYKWVIGRD